LCDNTFLLYEKLPAGPLQVTTINELEKSVLITDNLF